MAIAFELLLEEDEEETKKNKATLADEPVPEPDSLDDREFAIVARDEAYFSFHNTQPQLEDCRFTIPMELKTMEAMTVMDYLKMCARVSERRTQLYDRVFDEWARGGVLPGEKLVQAIREIVVCNVPDGYEKLIYELIGMNLDEDSVKLDKDMFRLICVAAERVIFSKLLKNDGIPIPLMHLVEMAEFQRFRRDYHTLQLEPSLDRFLDLVSL